MVMQLNQQMRRSVDAQVSAKVQELVTASLAACSLDVAEQPQPPQPYIRGPPPPPQQFLAAPQPQPTFQAAPRWQQQYITQQPAAPAPPPARQQAAAPLVQDWFGTPLGPDGLPLGQYQERYTDEWTSASAAPPTAPQWQQQTSRVGSSDRVRGSQNPFTTQSSRAPAPQTTGEFPVRVGTFPKLPPAQPPTVDMQPRQMLTFPAGPSRANPPAAAGLNASRHAQPEIPREQPREIPFARSPTLPHVEQLCAICFGVEPKRCLALEWFEAHETPQAYRALWHTIDAIPRRSQLYNHFSHEGARDFQAQQAAERFQRVEAEKAEVKYRKEAKELTRAPGKPKPHFTALPQSQPRPQLDAPKQPRPPRQRKQPAQPLPAAVCDLQPSSF